MNKMPSSVLFTVFLLLSLTQAFLIQQSNIQQQYAQQKHVQNPILSHSVSDYLSSNYSSNMTETQLKYVVNSIGAAERRYNQSQLSDIAKSIADNLATVFNRPWSVLVLNKTVTRIGVGALARQNKMASFIRTGTYELSYVVLQKNSCIYPNSSLNHNRTQTEQVLCENPTTSKMTKLRALVSAASTYGGNDITQNAIYLKTQMKKSLSEDWNAVIVEPAVTSGSYICTTYRFWAMFIKYVDFGWNYYLFGGDTN